MVRNTLPLGLTSPSSSSMPRAAMRFLKGCSLPPQLRFQHDWLLSMADSYRNESRSWRKRLTERNVANVSISAIGRNCPFNVNGWPVSNRRSEGWSGRNVSDSCLDERHIWRIPTQGLNVINVSFSDLQFCSMWRLSRPSATYVDACRVKARQFAPLAPFRQEFQHSFPSRQKILTQ